jgi:hypothetical protein
MSSSALKTKCLKSINEVFVRGCTMYWIVKFQGDSVASFRLNLFTFPTNPKLQDEVHNGRNTEIRDFFYYVRSNDGHTAKSSFPPPLWVVKAT